MFSCCCCCRVADVAVAAAFVAAVLVVENINISQAQPKPKPQNEFVGVAHIFTCRKMTSSQHTKKSKTKTETARQQMASFPQENQGGKRKTFPRGHSRQNKSLFRDFFPWYLGRGSPSSRAINFSRKTQQQHHYQPQQKVNTKKERK